MGRLEKILCRGLRKHFKRRFTQDVANNLDHKKWKGIKGVIINSQSIPIYLMQTALFFLSISNAICILSRIHYFQIGSKAKGSSFLCAWLNELDRIRLESDIRSISMIYGRSAEVGLASPIYEPFDCLPSPLPSSKDESEQGMIYWMKMFF